MNNASRFSSVLVLASLAWSDRDAGLTLVMHLRLMGGVVPHEAQAVQDRSAIGGHLTSGCKAIDLGFKIALS